MRNIYLFSLITVFVHGSILEAMLKMPRRSGARLHHTRKRSWTPQLLEPMGAIKRFTTSSVGDDTRFEKTESSHGRVCQKALFSSIIKEDSKLGLMGAYKLVAKDYKKLELDYEGQRYIYVVEAIIKNPEATHEELVFARDTIAEAIKKQKAGQDVWRASWGTWYHLREYMKNQGCIIGGVTVECEIYNLMHKEYRRQSEIFNKNYNKKEDL